MMRRLNQVRSGPSPFRKLRDFSTPAAPASVVDAFERWGHLRASLSPLSSSGLTGTADVVELPPRGEFPSLDSTYCGTTGYEFSHCDTAAERAWGAAAAAAAATATPLTPSEERNAATLLLRGHELESFLSRRYPGLKHYGGSGTESLLAAIDAVVAESKAERVVIGQAHRGRLALLVSLLGYPARQLFWKLDGKDDIGKAAHGLDDVNSHILHTGTLRGSIVSLLPNPSHLEAVNPVVQGKVRAAQDALGVSNAESRRRILPLLIHGDGAFSGQGVVAECFASSRTPGYDVGGTIHVVTNNLLAFTSGPREGRSSNYATDQAKVIGAPVIHVNGEDIRAVIAGARLAAAYRREFHRDVVLDLIGYRRQGHNEVDEPAFTSPKLYAEIRKRVPFAQALAERILGAEGSAAVTARMTAHLETEFTAARAAATPPAPANAAPAYGVGTKWAGVRGIVSESELHVQPATGASIEALRAAGAASIALPAGFALHERLQRSHVAPRTQALAASADAPVIDWATAEAMAFGTLLADGVTVRLSGQDAERGTFSHRHVVVVDQNTEVKTGVYPGGGAKGARMHVYSSLLSEEAVVGYEYGYSMESPDALTIWESQFGDFANSAQVVIDTFIATGETKWNRASGLVLLLPHGQDGAGPEHSSARIERFLQLCNGPAWAGPKAVVGADKSAVEPLNLLVAQPTTPANYFHLLRRQQARAFRKPLVIATPKALLRMKEACSPLTAMATSTKFQPVLDDPAAPAVTDPTSIRRVVLCSGKIFYELTAARVALLGGKESDSSRAKIACATAIVRIEELAPWPTAAVTAALARYTNAKAVVWAQDEPANAGAWAWARMHLPVKVTYVGRPALAACAVGLKKRHEVMQAEVIEAAFWG